MFCALNNPMGRRMHVLGEIGMTFPGGVRGNDPWR